MYVSHISLVNWRNFTKVDVDIQKRIFVVGPNASGKSNLLDVFRFLHDIAKQGGSLQNSVRDRGGLSKIRCLAARGNSKVTIDVSFKEDTEAGVDWRYLLSLRQEQRGTFRIMIEEEKIWKGRELLISRPNQEDLKDDILLTQTHLEQISLNRKFKPIVDFFSETTYFNLIPQLIKFPNAFQGQGMPDDPFGKTFLERVSRTKKNHRKAWLNRIKETLKVAVPQLEDLAFRTDDLGLPHLEATYAHWRAKGAKQDEKEFSDGTLRLIAFLWSMMDGKYMLLLEEPENSLHPAIVGQIAVLISKLQKYRHRQVMISTHSYELLNDKGIGLEEILLLYPDKEETGVMLASSLADAKRLLKESFSPAEIVIPRTTPKNIHQISLGI